MPDIYWQLLHTVALTWLFLLPGSAQFYQPLPFLRTTDNSTACLWALPPPTAHSCSRLPTSVRHCTLCRPLPVSSPYWQHPPFLLVPTPIPFPPTICYPLSNSVQSTAARPPIASLTLYHPSWSTTGAHCLSLPTNSANSPSLNSWDFEQCCQQSGWELNSNSSHLLSRRCNSFPFLSLVINFFGISFIFAVLLKRLAVYTADEIASSFVTIP